MQQCCGGHNSGQGALKGHRQIAISVRQLSDRHTETPTIKARLLLKGYIAGDLIQSNVSQSVRHQTEHENLRISESINRTLSLC